MSKVISVEMLRAQVGRYVRALHRIVPHRPASDRVGNINLSTETYERRRRCRSVHSVYIINRTTCEIYCVPKKSFKRFISQRILFKALI